MALVRTARTKFVVAAALTDKPTEKVDLATQASGACKPGCSPRWTCVKLVPVSHAIASRNRGRPLYINKGCEGSHKRCAYK